MKKYIYTHPDNVKRIHEVLRAATSHVHFPFEFEIRTDSSLPATKPSNRIIWPKDRFVEYEYTDLKWAVPLGFIKFEEDIVVYMLDHKVMNSVPHMIMAGCLVESNLDYGVKNVS